MTTSAETKWQRLQKRLDVFGRLLQNMIGIVIVAFAVLGIGGAAVVGTFRYFRGIGWQRSFLEVSATLIGLGGAYFARRPLIQYAKKITALMLRVLYYTAATIFYVSAVATALSLLSKIDSALTSFLTAPIGIKPATQATGLAEFFLPLMLSTAVSGLFYAIGKYFKDEVRTLLAAATPSGDLEIPTVNQ